MVRVDEAFAIVPLWWVGGVSGNAVKVYTVIAGFADAMGECYPARKSIAKRSELSLPTVDRCIQELRVAGALEISHRHGADGQQSNLYFLHRGTPTKTLTPPKKVAHELEPEIDKEKKETLLQLFNTFWGQYPRKVGKGAARTAHERALKKADAPTILAGLDRAKRSWLGTDPDFIPHPATWLNQERWEDEGTVGSVLPEEW